MLKNCKLIIFWFATRKKSRHPSMASFIIDTLNSTCLINKACLFTQRRQTPQFYPQRLPPWPPAAAVYSTAITQRVLSNTRNDTITPTRNSPGTVAILYQKQPKARSLLAECRDLLGNGCAPSGHSPQVDDAQY